MESKKIDLKKEKDKSESESITIDDFICYHPVYCDPENYNLSLQPIEEQKDIEATKSLS